MTSDAESAKGRGGLFASLARLFGRRGPEDDSAAADTPAGVSPAEPEQHQTDDLAEARPEPTAPAAAAAGDEDEDELVLGPALQASPHGQTEETDEGADQPALTGATETVEAGADATPAPNAEPEEEEILAKLRAARGEQDEDPGTEDRLTASEDEWAASFGAAVPETEPEEEAAETEEETTAGPGLSWLSADRRDEGEANLPEADLESGGPELMEAEEMGRRDADNENQPGSDEGEGVPETETFAAAETSAASETSAATVPLFPRSGADSAVEEQAPEDEGDESVGEAEPPEEAAEMAAAASTSEEPAPDAPGRDEDEIETPKAEELEVLEAEADKVATGEPGAETVGDEETGADEPEADETGAETVALGAGAAGERFAAGEAPPGEGASDAMEVAAGSDQTAVEETVRRLIREELEGDLGARLSANIRRMIQEEVARALRRPR